MCVLQPPDTLSTFVWIFPLENVSDTLGNGTVRMRAIVHFFLFNWNRCTGNLSRMSFLIRCLFVSATLTLASFVIDGHQGCWGSSEEGDNRAIKMRALISVLFQE